ncbi:MAG: AAA family ATPase [Pyrinomonadaceae bacterium]
MTVRKVNAKGDFKVLPVRHLSARVPWHDDKWNGKTCCNVLDNSFCRILKLIDDEKDPVREPSSQTIDDSNFPPCVAEKGTFLSPNEYTRRLDHKWKGINRLFDDFGPGQFHHKPYSFSAVPYLWMMKSTANPNFDFNPNDRPHKSVKALEFEVDYKTELEDEVDQKLNFEGNIWVQHPENQKALLDTFFGCLQEQKSLIFFYAKHTPLSEPNERVIVGVAKVRKKPGGILEYTYPAKYSGHKSYPWDRCVEHTLRPADTDGFLLPYHAILNHVLENNSEIDLHDFVAVAPDFGQFSFGTELVEHDTAIDSLLAIAESLRKSQDLLGQSFADELSWVDREISKIWDMRGAFPGLGPILSAIGIESGNTIAWEIEKFILDKDGDLLKINPWDIFEESINQPEQHFGYRGRKLFTSTIKTKWTNKPLRKKQLYKLLSRCQLNNDQAEFLLKEFATSIEEVFDDPYILYERTREGQGISFRQVDKALFPPEKIRTSFPLSEGVVIDNQLDERRIRALSVWVMEEAAGSDGHSLLPFDDLLNRLMGKQLDEAFPIDEDTLEVQSETEFFQDEIQLIPASKENKTRFLKLKRLQEIRSIILERLDPKTWTKPAFNITRDWMAVVNDFFEDPTNEQVASDQQMEIEARYEKAMALAVLSNYRFSVLIGPAGSGKTTLLEIFEQQPEIRDGGILKLAPTGKARVKLGPKAQTVAQFLYPSRYNPGLSDSYRADDTAPKISVERNIIVDEASMLTEEQLAALLDALGPIDRLILVGDYRQLPPIGTGRPFFDIIQKLKPEQSTSAPIAGASFQPYTGAAYAELTKNMRQAKSGDVRWDVSLSRCFSDSVEKQDLELFRQLSSGDLKSDHLRLEKWYASDDFRELFKRVLEDELGLDQGHLERSFNSLIGAVEEGGFQYFNCGDAEKKIEAWQVLSPVNGYGFGVKEINKFVQLSYRRGFLNLAHSRARLIAKPKGSDNVVYGDKVINLRNSRWQDWQKIEPKEKKASALNYIANGEIGIITGKFRSRNSPYTGEPNIEIAFSTQPNYSYVFRPKQLGEESRYSVELAYAITIHKAQGSGFKKVFLVLPSKGAILSRELLYTALTRQEDKIVILHQGEFRDFIRFASSTASATARRFTDLFYLPDIKQIETKYYDGKYINISSLGEPMISKNEVIIANLLNDYRKQIRYAYEDKLKFDETGRTVKPDFIVDHLTTGRRFYWEHLGMMTLRDYRERWEKKRAQYLKEGFVLHTQAKPDDRRVLIVTEENPNGGINSQEIDLLIRNVILGQ